MDADRRIQTVCLLILTAIALGAALQYLSPVLIPFVLAVFFTYCLAPVIEFQIHRLRMPRILAVATTIALGCGVLVAAGAACQLPAAWRGDTPRSAGWGGIAVDSPTRRQGVVSV